MNIERKTLEARAARHAALADVARLAVMEELALGDRSPSELQEVVGLRSNLMAHHLKVLEDAGLVVRRRSEGDRRRTYLTLVDTALLEQVPADELRVGRVVFVCSANSARSQLAAALWRQSSDVPVASAGTHPAERISAGAKAVARRRSLKLVSTTPQQFTDIAVADDFVIAVCDNAYEELGGSVSLHWSIPDPVSQGDDAAFDHAYAELDRRVTTLAPRLIAS
jgi:protein-tyrosine-phosphatase